MALDLRLTESEEMVKKQHNLAVLIVRSAFDILANKFTGRIILWSRINP